MTEEKLILKVKRGEWRMQKLKTMLKVEKNDSNSRYYITKTEYMLKVINQGYLSISKKDKKNIAYSLRYLEFLQLQLDELILDDMMIKMIWKNFIITSVAIIELLMIAKTNCNSFGKELLEKFTEENPFGLEEELLRLDHFRKLRNRVHLKIKFDDEDTDWFQFKKEDYLDIKKLLYKILTSKIMLNQNFINYIDFLK